MARKTQELRPVMTRIPEPLRRRLERSAAGSGRSMNTEIIHRLEESYLKNERYAAEQREQMDHVSKRLMVDLLATFAKLAGDPNKAQFLDNLAAAAAAVVITDDKGFELPGGILAALDRGKKGES